MKFEKGEIFILCTFQCYLKLYISKKNLFSKIHLKNIKHKTTYNEIHK